MVNIAKLEKEFRTLKVKILSLLGEAPDKLTKKAVIREDMKSLGNLNITQRVASGAPTQSDFNELAEDVAKIAASLDAIAKKLER
jgi:hypothetical protein